MKVNAIIDLCFKRPGHIVVLKDDVIAEKDRDRLLFSANDSLPHYTLPVTVGTSYELREFRFSMSAADTIPTHYSGDGQSEYVDGDRIQEPLTLRTWKHGDWFIPLGMNGRKKLSDYFADQKVPRLGKSTVPVLESNGNIVWVCGRRLDDRYKITDKTTHAVKLTYTPTTSPAN